MLPDTLVTHSLFLIGEGIGKSLTPAMHEREGRELGMSVSYHLVDALELGLAAPDLPDVLTWAKRLGFTGFNVTHPFKQAIIPHLDAMSDRASRARRGQHRAHPGRAGHRAQHRLVRLPAPLARQLPEAASSRVVQLGAGGAGAAVAYALLDLGVKHLTILDAVPGKADELVARMGQLYSPDRVHVGTDLAAASGGRRRHRALHPDRDGDPSRGALSPRSC